ncbi:hypothetical protein B9T07_21795, partial [Limnospira fusiformis CCALA 023]
MSNQAPQLTITNFTLTAVNQGSTDPTGDNLGTIIDRMIVDNPLNFSLNTNISLTGVYRSSVATADFNGDGHIDILLTGSSDSGNISQVYLNDGSGGFTEATNISLTGVDFSSVATADFNGDGHIDILLTGSSDSGTISLVYLNDGSGGFTEATNTSLTGVVYGSVATADFNGDGHIDILLTGEDSDFEPISRVYLNDGSGGFTEATNISLTGVGDSSVATADFNGDGDIDILLTGLNDSVFIKEVYLNDGSGGFTEATNISLTGVFHGSVATGDFNGDGHIDILLTSRDSSFQLISRVYLNDGSGGFTEATNISLTGVGDSSVATADFNGDGHIDILLTGMDSSFQPISQVYLNDGSGGFTEATNISLTGVGDSSVATADFNGDGHIDILLTGMDSSFQPISQVYLNDGSGGFTEATNISLTGVGDSSVATADFNGDGHIDILLTGLDSSFSPISQVYTNDPIEVPPGQAIYEADSSNGTWQYSTDGGATWVDFPTVSETNALLLDSSSQVRFVPNPDYRGEATYNFRAWDQSDGLLRGT